MNAPTPLLDCFRRGEAPRDVRLEAARGSIAPRAEEQAELLAFLLDDPDDEVRIAARNTLARIPRSALDSCLSSSAMSPKLRETLAEFGTDGGVTEAAPHGSLIDTDPTPEEIVVEGLTNDARKDSVAQQVLKMGFPERLKAAVKGSREMRAVLIRDPNKTISAAVLSSPKLTEAEVESFARLANLPEEILRIIGSNRSWTKNYRIVVGLTKNPKTPLTMSMNFLARLNDRDLQMLSIDRNVPDPLRVAARKKLIASTSR